MYIASSPLSKDFAELISRFCMHNGWSELALVTRDNNMADSSFSDTLRNVNHAGAGVAGVRLLADIRLSDDPESNSMARAGRLLLECRASVVLVRMDVASVMALFRALSSSVKSRRLWILTGGAAQPDKRYACCT